MLKRRPVPRHLCAGPAQLHEGPGNLLAKLEVLNISTQGCRVRGATIPEVGQRCGLLIDWRGANFQCEVEVKWKAPTHEAGLEFLSMDEGKMLALRELCRQLPLEPLRPLPPQQAAKVAKTAGKRKRSG